MRLLTISLVFAFLFFCGAGPPPSVLADDSQSVAFDTTRMVKEIQVLSGPEFSGRQTGTDGGLASAAFVAQRFRELGLTPAGNIGLGPGMNFLHHACGVKGNGLRVVLPTSVV